VAADREPESIIFEADYWLSLLNDLSELNGRIHDAAGPLPSVPLAALELLLGSDPKPTIDRIGAAVKATLDAIQAMQAPVDRMIDLAGGRVVALRREGGLEQ